MMCLFGMRGTIAPVVERILSWSTCDDQILLKHVAQSGATKWDASAVQELGVPAAACAVRFLALISSATGNRKQWREEELEVLIKVCVLV